MMIIKRTVAAFALAVCTAAAFAVPTVDAVQAEVKSGNYAKAETMMQEVVAAKPGSARAHYVYAEILAHNKHFDLAAGQVAAAREIDPALAFTDPVKFRSLEQLLQREQAAAKPRVSTPPPTSSLTPAIPAAEQAPPVQRSGGVPGWVWALGLAGVAALVWKMVSNRQAAPAGSMPAGSTLAPSAAAGYGPSYAAGYGPAMGGGMPQQAPGRGSGMLGVGLAAAGGVAAGMLAEKLLQGGHEGNGFGNAFPGAVPGPSGTLFDDPRPDDAAARELEERPVDFGNGGDDWGGDSNTGSDDGGGW